MNEESWYSQLSKPTWAPDETVFGRVWSVLYPVIIVVNLWVVILYVQNKISWQTALPFWLNIIFNLSFTPIQFGLRNNWLASVDILLVLATTIWAMLAIWPYNKYLALAYIPYAIWVTIASALQLSITYLNR